MSGCAYAFRILWKFGFLHFRHVHDPFTKQDHKARIKVENGPNTQAGPGVT
ncbi:uncharacterized protein DS421_5g143550 [Arachis hypogaea]|nr:uncharacterized protein DS421_5g143550 [Arachis hypogaea]